MSKELKVISAIFMLLASYAFLIDGNTVKKTSELQLSFSEFDEIVSATVDTISAVDLADYLIQQKHHYNLINVQEIDIEEASYIIPSAEIYSFNSFLKLNIPTNETIFLYSSNEVEAVQLYYLLIIRGYFKVKVLKGGLSSWLQQIITPNISKIQFNELPRRKLITNFFGGNFNNQLEQVNIKTITIDKKIKKHHGC